MAMFTFYGDESHGKIDAYAVAGYIATVEQWAHLAREWRELGEREGFTILHKRLLEHNIKGSEFEWPDLTPQEKQDKKKRINNAVCKIILRRVTAGFAASVTKSVWDEAVIKSRWADNLGKSFYAAGVYVCLTLMSGWIKNRPHTVAPVEGIRYIFENGADGRKEARKFLQSIKDDPLSRDMYKMQGFDFEDKEKPDYVPLQAADFLAYEAYRQLDNRVIEGIKLDKHGKPFEVRGALKCLLQQDDSRYAAIAGPHPDRAPTPHFGLFLDEPKTMHLLNVLETRFPLVEGDDA
jgi:hypothetical protein